MNEDQPVMADSERTGYAPPESTPEDCDHEDYEAGVRGACTHCCPCPDCGAERWLDREETEA
jgi:hypothetical protein